MVAPTLNDYEYQFKDSGVLLNGTSTVPFWDVEKVTGLADFPQMDPKIHDYDGRHGSSVYARFFQHRVVVIDGTLYASATDFDTPLETMRTSLLPNGNDYPFYFKHPNKSQRYVNAKMIGFSCDIDTGRRYGAGKFQIQLAAGDPRHYVDASTNWTNNVNFNLNNQGNTAVGPVISVTSTATTACNITVQNVTTSRSIQFSFAVTTGAVVTVDTDNYAILYNGAYRSTGVTVTGTDWPVANPGVTETWKVLSNIGNGTATNKSTWL